MRKHVKQLNSDLFSIHTFKKWHFCRHFKDHSTSKDGLLILKKVSSPFKQYEDTQG